MRQLIRIARRLASFPSEDLYGVIQKACLARYVSSGFEVIKLFSCPAQLSMTFFLLINVEMPTFVVCWHFSIYEREK